MKKKSLIALILFAVLLVAVFAVWKLNRPVPSAGQKEITLEVVHSDGSSAVFPIKTDADNLRGALEEVDGLVAGEESAYGLMVYTVDGETADWRRNQSWWCLTRNGERLDTGVDSTVIADGEHYEFTYTIG